MKTYLFIYFFLLFNTVFSINQGECQGFYTECRENCFDTYTYKKKKDNSYLSFCAKTCQNLYDKCTRNGK